MFRPPGDLGLQLSDRIERALLQSSIGELSEPTLDEVEPRRTGMGEVQVPACASGGLTRS